VPAALFISDLHLSGERPAINERFFAFLQEQASRAASLFVLGDLFEYWIGDEQVDWPEYRPVMTALRALVDAGVPVYVIVGNRDFLMGRGFEAASGCRLLDDVTRIDLYGRTVLVMHGDELCTRDTEFMKFRAMVRDPQWRRDFLAKSVAERQQIAGEYREISQQTTAAKKPEIMDVTPEAVDEVMRRHGVRDLIHGHTHRPARHRFQLDGAAASRIVLGDWYDQGSVLRCSPADCELAALPIETAADKKLKAGS
jgi:UDP-2,3-diacylglucosamine hydrolase